MKKGEEEIKYSEGKGYPNALSEYDIKNLIPEDKKFIESQLKYRDYTKKWEIDEDTKKELIPIFRLRKSIENLAKKTSAYSKLLVALTIVLVALTMDILGYFEMVGMPDIVVKLYRAFIMLTALGLIMWGVCFLYFTSDSFRRLIEPIKKKWKKLH